jgi:hypothetical protein
MSADEYTIRSPIVFVKLMVKASSYPFTQQVPRFSLNFKSLEEKFTRFSDYTISHYDYGMSIGNLHYPEQLDSNSLSRKYKPKELVTFTVNTLPVLDRPLRANISRLDIEYETDCSYDSLMFLKPYDFAQKPSLANYSQQVSHCRWVIHYK